MTFDPQRLIDEVRAKAPPTMLKTIEDLNRIKRQLASIGIDIEDKPPRGLPYSDFSPLRPAKTWEDIAEYEDSASSPRSWIGDPPRDSEE
ncbi:MAG: hypothetical protein LBP86_03190 [Azoarcus sp.]|jgi:hypothetical protein|nr:hypothetical protein [Azoarcus sp.]